MGTSAHAGIATARVAVTATSWHRFRGANAAQTIGIVLVLRTQLHRLVRPRTTSSPVHSCHEKRSRLG